MSAPASLAESMARVVSGETLDAASMERAMETILAGEATPVLVAGLAVALRMRGETPEELAAAARAMRRRVPRPSHSRSAPILDTCGTGGDGKGTFNVSTAAALVVAAAGVPVAKHGNRAVSSRAGSADVLEALGVGLDASPALVARHLDELGIGFFFAPAFHSALKHAAPVRRELGIRTFFNLLGPLTNPGGATHQLVGVFEASRTRTMAEVLGLLGIEAAWVVHGHGGLDEISPSGPTRVARLQDGHVDEIEITPADFGLALEEEGSIGGGDAQQNAALMRDLLGGAPGPRRSAVLLSAAASLVVAGVETDLRVARERAEAAIDTGAAGRLLERWIGMREQS